MKSLLSSVLRVHSLVVIALVLALPAAIATSSHVAGATPAAQGEVFTKALASPGVLDPSGPGITLWHDYGAFALYRLSPEAYAGLSNATRSQLSVDPEMDTILFDRHPLDTRSSRLELPDALKAGTPGGTALHLVQFVGPIQDAWLEEVVKTGAVPVHYIANNAYLVWADAAARSQLDALASDGDFVQFSLPHQPGFKLGPSIENRILEGTEPNENLPVTIQIYSHAGKTASQAVIGSLTVEQLVDWWPILDYENTTVTVRARDLLTIARLPDVAFVGERFPRELDDEVQGQIVASNFNANQSGPSAPGYKAWLDSFGFNQNPASYPVVSVADDGIGNGSVTNGAGDVTLTRLADGTTTRLAFIANCTTDASGGGTDGHGHINTSIVGGYDVRSGFPFRDPNGYQRGQGINPYGRMAGTKIFRNGGSYSVSACGGTDVGVIKSQQDNGARISSNSWGCSGCAGTYDDSSQAYDVGVRDADLTEAGNQQMTFVFSAGNSGSSSGTIGTPGNGKNMITVGASENQRPSDESGSWTDGCAVGPTGADNAMDIISFSSRGPAPGGRAKPETIAPGTHIQGTASTNAGYNGSGVCDQYRPGGQTVFAASSGTSHSAPAVSGVASLYTYWLENTYGFTAPSPALVKAYVIGHPTYLTGVSANDTLPSNNQGYGMPDMDAAFDSIPRYLLDQTIVFDNSGETWTWTGSIPDATKPLRVVLNYTDAAGAQGTSPQVNNLNLTVVVNGVTYLGNRFSGRWSTTGGTADTANNYEAVFLPAGTTGSLSITVTGFNIAGNGIPNVGDGTDQDFAFVCYNCSQTPDFSVGVTPETANTCAPADAAFDISLGSLNGYITPVTFSASGHPAGTTATFNPNPVTPPGASTLTIGNTGAAAAGTYDITITGISGALTHQDNVTLNLATASPAVAVLTAPPDGATNQASTPVFTWNAVSQAVSYEIQVATDLAFSNIVASATGLTATTFTPGAPLAPDTLYYWRVRAANGCGIAGWPAAAAFRTAGSACLTYNSTDVPKAILDNTTINSTLSVPATFALTDVNVTIGQITHTYDGDLDIYIVHPDATQVELSTDNGGSGDNYINTVFDDEAATAITSGSAPFTGSFRPEGLLSALDGKTATGTWKLRVTDDASSDTGTLSAWSLTACGDVPPVVADYSDLASSYGVAWHTGNGALRLGSLWTADTSFAEGHDDAVGGDGSDDGVAPALNAWWGGGRGAFDVTSSGSGCVNGWMDFGDGTGVGSAHADGDFGDNFGGISEQVIASRPVNTGLNNLSFTVPAGILGGGSNTYAFRFRLTARKVGAPCSDSGNVSGAAGSGEVEDYRITFGPLAVTLAAFTAEASAEVVTLRWETVSETDNAGFNVYRGQDLTGLAGTCQGCDWVRLNAALIPAADPGASQGSTYTWADATAAPGASYWYLLEDVALDGTVTRHAPVAVTMSEPNALGLAGFGAVATGPTLAGLVSLALIAFAGAALRRRR